MFAQAFGEPKFLEAGTASDRDVIAPVRPTTAQVKSEEGGLSPEKV